MERARLIIVSNWLITVTKEKYINKKILVIKMEVRKKNSNIIITIYGENTGSGNNKYFGWLLEEIDYVNKGYNA